MPNRIKTVARRSLFALLLAFTAMLGGGWVDNPTAEAVAGINQRINFQGRLLTAEGATVPDGYYNLQFRVYQDGDGQTAGNATGSPAGSLEWTESYLNANGNGVMVRNGYLSVELGSVTPFGSSIDWNQDTLWLSVNVGSTNGSCTPFSSCSPDGEMLPMRRFSSTPYALNAGMLGGRDASGFIQNSTSPQAANFNITGDGLATNLQGTTSVATPALRSLSDSTTGIQIQNTAGTSTIMNIDTQNSRVGIGTTAPTTTLNVAANNSAVNNPILLVEQQGSGDASLEFKDTSGKSFYVGMDKSSGSSFKISSSTSVQSSFTEGNTVVGGSANTSLDDSIVAKKVTTGAQGGALSSISMYVGNVDTGAPGAKVAIYAHDAANNRPGVIIAESAAQNLVTGWNNMPISGILDASTTYWIGAKIQGSSSIMYSFCSGCAGESVFYNARPYGDSWPSPAGAPLSTSTNENYSWYLTGTFGTISDTFGGQDLFKLTDTGALTLQNSTNSTQALKVQNAAGTSVLSVDTTNNFVGIGTAASAPTATLSVGGSFTSAGGAINLNVNSNSTVSIGTGTSTGAVTIGNSLNTTSLGSNTINLGNAAGATTLEKTAQTATNTTGSALTIKGATGNGTGAGGVVNVQGGNAGLTNANGGNLVLSGGTGTGTGSNGLVVLSTPTFSTTANDANCYTGGALVASTCTITQASVNNSSAVIIGFSTTGQTATMPDPTILTAGRVVYVTAANGSSDFTLTVNGGGQANQIAMRQNTTATMIWNGADWTAAGASSSTTLQSAYDNTLQSAGGAELVVSKTSTTNGFTIRDSSTNPVNGTLLSVQSSSAAGLFSVNSDVTEYATNAGAENAGASASTFPANTWSAIGGSTVTRHNTAGNYIATGQGSTSVVTSSAALSGVKNQLSSALSSKTTYNVSLTTRLLSGTFTDLEVYYSIDGTTASVPCVSSKAVTTSVWTKINCTFTAPTSGITSSNALFIRQAGSGTARTFYVDNASVTIAADYNYATDAGVSDAGNFATNWTSVGGASVSRTTATGYDASDSAQVITTGANQGIRNKLSVDPLPNTLYRITVYANALSPGFNSFTARYSRDGGTNFTGCADYNTQSVSSAANSYTKITCYITTDGTAPTNPHMYFTQTDATGRTFYVDAFSITLSSNSTPNVQIGGGVNGGPTTLLTLDKGASAPIAGDNEALLGSMYYDTTLGKLQCYEADGWGACGSSPDNIVTISPEYTNAVLHGTGIGTMTSDLCSDALDINDGTSSQPTVCGTNETYNFYKWTSPQPTTQSYGIYVTYQLPATFKSFQSGQTSLMGRTDSSNSSVAYQIYKSGGSGLIPCGSAVNVSSGAQTAWQIKSATGTSDPSTCSFNAGNSIVFKINVTASSNANAYVGNLNFTFNNK